MKRTYAPFLPGIIVILLSAFSSQAQPLLTASVTTTGSCQNNGTITVNLSGDTGPYYYYLYTGTTVYDYIGQPIVNTSDSYHDYSFFMTPTVIGPISQSSYTFTDLANGGYKIIAYSENNFVSSDNYYVNVAAAFDASLTFLQGDCKGQNGSITAVPSGGTAPYSYLWTGGATTSSLTLSSQQPATLRITDANGCVFKSVDSMLIYPTYDFNLNLTGTPFSCSSAATATVSVTGAADTYTYSWNTVPAQTTATATITKDGLYEVVVTNSTGCQLHDTLYVYHDNAFTLEIAHDDATCTAANGSATVTASNGVEPYSYVWNTGATTAGITGLTGKTSYQVTVTDANSCESTGYIYIDALSPLRVSFLTYNPTCSTNGSSATATVINGQEPYTYDWGNGATTATISNVAVGGYNLTVTDDNGCDINTSVYIPLDDICYDVIAGKVYYDLNENGIQDADEQGIHTTLSATSNTYHTIGFPDSDGLYQIKTLPEQYTLSVDIPEHWKISSASSASLFIDASTPGQLFTNKDFGLVPEALVSDVAVYAYTGSQRPGYAHSSTINYINLGTQPESGTVEYTFSEGWEISRAYPTADSYDPTLRKATWNYMNLGILESRTIELSMYVPVDVTLGTLISGEVTINTTQTDVDLSNNQSSCSTNVQDSYDPNDMLVSPQGTGTEGYITDSEDQLTYKIDFQNTGTDVAYNISVTNDLDANLDASTFIVLTSTHTCQSSLANGQLTFDFHDINLPDSNANEPGSHGYVIYKIKRKTDLAPETPIYNKANIYFDYNTPVATNQVLNTTARTTASVGSEQTSQDVALYPNPSNNQFSIRFNAQEDSNYSIQLYSAAGQEMPLAENLQATAGMNTTTLSLASLNLPNGLYVVKLVVGTQSFTKNLMLSR